MEEAINDAIHTTVGTFVDKAATGAMENASAETSDRAAEERVKSAEKQVKILEEKVKALEEKLKVAEDNFTTAIDNAVQEKVKEVEELMQSKIQRATRMAKLQAQIDLGFATIDERREWFCKVFKTNPDLNAWLREQERQEMGEVHDWWLELGIHEHYEEFGMY